MSVPPVASPDIDETVQHLLATGIQEFLREFAAGMFRRPADPRNVELTLAALRQALLALLGSAPEGRAALHAFALDLIESVHKE